ncbi:hypothetical protein Hanom_Chr09g00843691 [Helianthus anomalus]
MQRFSTCQSDRYHLFQCRDNLLLSEHRPPSECTRMHCSSAHHCNRSRTNCVQQDHTVNIQTTRFILIFNLNNYRR